jgi:hypothetical protein
MCVIFPYMQELIITWRCPGDSEDYIGRFGDFDGPIPDDLTDEVEAGLAGWNAGVN